MTQIKFGVFVILWDLPLENLEHQGFETTPYVHMDLKGGNYIRLFKLFPGLVSADMGIELERIELSHDHIHHHKELS